MALAELTRINSNLGLPLDKLMETTIGADGRKYRPKFAPAFDIWGADSAFNYQNVTNYIRRGTNFLYNTAQSVYGNIFVTEHGIVAPVDRRIYLYDKDTLKLKAKTEPFAGPNFQNFCLFGGDLFFINTNAGLLYRMNLPDLTVGASVSVSSSSYQIKVDADGVYLMEGNYSYRITRRDIDTLTLLSTSPASFTADSAIPGMPPGTWESTYVYQAGYGVTKDYVVTLGGNNNSGVNYPYYLALLNKQTLAVERYAALLTSRLSTAYAGITLNTPSSYSVLIAVSDYAVIMRVYETRYNPAATSLGSFYVDRIHLLSNGEIVAVIPKTQTTSIVEYNEVWVDKNQSFHLRWNNTTRARYDWNAVTSTYELAYCDDKITSSNNSIVPDSEFGDLIFTQQSVDGITRMLGYIPKGTWIEPPLSPINAPTSNSATTTSATSALSRAYTMNVSTDTTNNNMPADIDGENLYLWPGTNSTTIQKAKLSYNLTGYEKETEGN